MVMFQNKSILKEEMKLMNYILVYCICMVRCYRGWGGSSCIQIKKVIIEINDDDIRKIKTINNIAN